MRRRLLNPKQKLPHEDLDNLPIELIDGVKYRKATTISRHVDDGRCQCFKDCDCSQRKGNVTITETKWYRTTEHDGTDKCFYSEPYKKRI